MINVLDGFTANKEHFDELVPTKPSIARFYFSVLQSLSQQQHNHTHKDVYDKINERYLEIFGRELPFASYESFKKYIIRNRKEIYYGKNYQKKA